jgi:uncharacterized membrane protein YphA (DoxX/SURF4 family)
MIVERRRILGGFAVLALVLLRLVIGWHFFGEGTKKLQYDREDGWHMAFSADDFLGVAKGPLADWYHDYMPGEHEWRKLLAKPRENAKPSADELAAQAKWQKEYNSERAAAVKDNKLAPVKFPPSAPYHDWAEKIADDWRATAEKAKAVPGMTEAQKQDIDKALNSRLETLAEYLAGEEEGITAYRHELGRLKDWRDAPEAEGVPFYKQRIATKTTETTAQLKGWVKEVQALEDVYHADLANILTPEQRKQASTTNAMSAAITGPSEAKLNKLNLIVTILTIGVGTCLLLGFFTRLASIAGAIFLLGVILSQPFWLSDSIATMPQITEFAGLLVLAATGAGRWFGLDYFTYRMFHRNQQLKVVG